MLASNLELLRHIQDEVKFIIAHTGNIENNQLEINEVLSRAVIRSLEIIGEATKKISEEIKSDYPFVEWKKMAGLRDKLIHDYFGIDYEIVDDVVINKIPQLNQEIDQIIEDIQKRIDQNNNA